MTPSIKTLEQAFPGKGKELRALLTENGRDENYASVRDWVAQCHNRPPRVERVMVAANEIIGGHGTEAIFAPSRFHWPDMEYVNLGDTYITTLIYDYTRGRYLVMSWGDWLERQERAGKRYD